MDSQLRQVTFFSLADLEIKYNYYMQCHLILHSFTTSSIRFARTGIKFRGAVIWNYILKDWNFVLMLLQIVNWYGLKTHKGS